MPRKLSKWRMKLPCASTHRRQLSAYLDDELEPGARAGVEAHLVACPSCRDEYEQLRFASRALLSHFAVPETRPPVWQAAPALRPQPSAPPLSWLERFCAMKITIPAPALAAGTLAALVLAALFFTAPFVRTETPAALPPAALPSIATKLIEIPVEREIVRERIVTRTVYLRRPRQSYRDQPSPPAALEPVPPISVAERTPSAMRDGSDQGGRIFVRASVEGFRPAAVPNLRIVKEPER